MAANGCTSSLSNAEPLQTVFSPVAAGGSSHTFVSLYDWVEFRGVSLQPGQKTVVEVNAPEARIAHWRSRQWQAHCIRFHRRIARRYPQVVSSTGVSNRERSRAPVDFTGAAKRMSPIAPESAPGAVSRPRKVAEVWKTEADSRIGSAAEVGPTSAPKAGDTVPP